jgi:hypothetical protein
MSINQRIKAFTEYKKISIRKFEKICGLSNGYVNNLNYTIGEDKLQKIIQQYPELNPVWLQMGKGEMLKDNRVSDPSELYQKSENPPDQNDKFATLMDLIKQNGELISANKSLAEANRQLSEANNRQTMMLATLMEVPPPLEIECPSKTG